MNLEQIVKETVAKIVAEKHLTPAEMKKKEEIVKAMKATFKEPSSAMYAIATKKAEKLAEDDLNEDYEVAMAQDSLDSIIRAAMMLKAEMGDNEVNLPAWIQDHITNSENYINQAAKGYHESDAQMDNNAGAEGMDESTQPENLTINGKRVKSYNRLSSKEGGDGSYDVEYVDGTKDNFKVSNDNWDIIHNNANPSYRINEAVWDIIHNNKSQELDEHTIRRWQHYAGIK
jgi:hypothetical protein